VTEEQWLGVAGAIGTAVTAIVGMMVRRQRLARLAEPIDEGSAEGRLWSRITGLEDRIRDLEMERDLCREHLAEANLRIAILERDMQSLRPPPGEVNASP